MAKGNRPATSSAEDTLPLGAVPKDMELALEPHVATPEELAAEAARLEAERLELDELLRQDEAKLQAEHEAAEAATSEAARLASSPLGPLVKVHAHGALLWDASHYAANEEFQVDTSKHSEADFLALLASGTLLRAE
jgi:hypothetical protein